MDAHLQLGLAGEEAAMHYLMERDYHILERNWRWHHLEVDLIADDFGEIVFVEVKTRSSQRWESPEARVDYVKQRHLVDAAQAYLRCKQLLGQPFRFDIITLVGTSEAFDIQHFKHAFPL